MAKAKKSAPKKAAAKKVAAKKSIPKKKSAQQKKPFSTAGALKAGMQVTAVTFTSGGGRNTKEELQVIKSIHFRVKKIDFEIQTGINLKKKLLVIDVAEIDKGLHYKIRTLRYTQKISQLNLKAEKYEGYSKALEDVKAATRIYSATASAELERDIRSGKLSTEQIYERMRLFWDK